MDHLIVPLFSSYHVERGRFTPHFARLVDNRRMANQDHLAHLRSGDWDAWRQAHPTLAPDLIDAPLSGEDLHAPQMGKAQLQGVEF